MAKNKEQGFTLVELSIVIVIIGLIVAGVVGGQSLINQAQLRSIITEQASVKTAVKAFRTEYSAIPGDMPNAFTYWAGCASATEADCNGDGNRQVAAAGSTVNDSESYRFWEHLNLASLYPGAFTGVALGTGFNGGERGVNLPASKFPGASISYHIDSGGTRDHHILFGADVTNNVSNGDIFTPNNAISLDEKMDDGSPENGIVRAATSNTDADAGTNCIDTGEYDLTEPTTTCHLWVID